MLSRPDDLVTVFRSNRISDDEESQPLDFDDIDPDSMCDDDEEESVKKKRVRVDSHEKIDAVRSVLSGTSVAEVANNYGVSIPTVYSWKKAYADAEPINGFMSYPESIPENPSDTLIMLDKINSMMDELSSLVYDLTEQIKKEKY